jgi:hypothetical protein
LESIPPNEHDEPANFLLLPSQQLLHTSPNYKLTKQPP